ncbi:glycosyltransferase family 2 protein [Paenibacillus humicola]|uniref:glycosyltransferase family 2 protein n=1 Tax=Paenibacillus humicola TaxID=3110540 RepID=UPI00237BCDDA|nr:glycosyltransferase family 2 protein [Paenibacillus humicola]
MLLVFVLDTGANARSLQMTERLVRSAPINCRVVPLQRDFAAAMNREILSGYTEPFFVTLLAGESVDESFLSQADAWMRRADDTVAGLLLNPESGWNGDEKRDPPRGPVVWRTEAVRSGNGPGFATLDRLPFERYVLLELQYRLTPAWRWSEIAADCWSVRRGSNPGWMRTREEWEALAPLLAAKPSSQTAGCRPLFSVVICTYNDAPYLKWAIRSVFVQQCPDWELIIVDDGSHDETALILEAEAADPRVTVLRNETNRGKGFSLNRALAHAKGAWLVELDADDWLAPDCLSVFAAHIRSESESESELRTGAYFAGHYEWQQLSGGHQPVYRNIRQPARFTPETLLEYAEPLAPRCFSLSALRELGGWLVSDPFGGSLYEDIQMLLRMAQFYAVKRSDGTLYHRRLRPDSVTSVNRTSYSSWKKWFLQTVCRSGNE